MNMLRWRTLAGVCRRDARAFASAGTDTSRPWDDFNNVTKELRRISQEEGLDGRLPDTKLLKTLGHNDLVLAIRKKHGGFVAVTSKIGAPVKRSDLDVQKRLTSRANRRRKRQIRTEKHDFY